METLGHILSVCAVFTLVAVCIIDLFLSSGGKGVWLLPRRLHGPLRLCVCLLSFLSLTCHLLLTSQTKPKCILFIRIMSKKKIFFSKNFWHLAAGLTRRRYSLSDGGSAGGVDREVGAFCSKRSCISLRTLVWSWLFCCHRGPRLKVFPHPVTQRLFPHLFGVDNCLYSVDA